MSTFFIPDKLERTPDDFTTGIVNVPQNTPAIIYFVCENEIQKDTAVNLMQYHKIPYVVISKRNNKYVIKSKDIISYGLTKLLQKNSHSVKVKRKAIHRYLFFELDDLDVSHFQFVLAIYHKYNLPVFYHRTMRGWHFICIKPIDEKLWQEALTELKPLNTACPHVTLRIKPNKWVGEREIFQQSAIQMPALHSDTVQLQKSFMRLCDFNNRIVGNEIAKLKEKYLIVHYRQTGELANL